VKPDNFIQLMMSIVGVLMIAYGDKSVGNMWLIGSILYGAITK
jgi:hypothetical protein